MIDLALGFLAAVLTSIPMLGPVVLLLFSAGLAADEAAARRARWLAVGAALGEGAHVALAVYGVGPWLLSLPAIAGWLRVVAGLALVGLALVAWRARAEPRPFGPRRARDAFGLGLGLVLTNPGFLVTWIAVLAFLAQHAPGLDARAAFVVGAAAGVLAWFLTVLELARRLGPRLASRLAQVRTLVALGLVALGLWLTIAGVLALAGA